MPTFVVSNNVDNYNADYLEISEVFAIFTQHWLLNVLKKTAVILFRKKKRHTHKTQILADKSSRNIICTFFGNGRKHDFKLFKNSKIYLKETSKCLVDSGYQGIQKLHINSEQPKSLYLKSENMG